LTELASGGSVTASDSGNIVRSVGSFVGGAIGSVAGQAKSKQGAALGESVGGAITGTAKYINL